MSFLSDEKWYHCHHERLDLSCPKAQGPFSISFPPHVIPFNVPAGVIGVADLLLQSNPNEDQRMLLETIRTSGESLLQILSDILDLSKIENEKMTLEYSDWDLRTHLDESLNVFRIRAQQNGLEVRGGEGGRKG